MNFLPHQVCLGMEGVLCLGLQGLSEPHCVGLAEVLWRLRVLGMPLGLGNSTRTLDSGVVQQASGVPHGHGGGA